MSPTCQDVDFDLKLAELKINGYTVFEDMIPVATVDRIRAAFLPLLDDVMGRADPSEMGGPEMGDVRTGQGRLQTTNRYTLTIPWMEPFADAAIYQHPVILEFLDRYWQADGYILTCYHSNTPCTGSAFQHWHRDTNIGKEIPHIGLETVPVVGVKFPLVDTWEENGSFEVLPSTQYLADPRLEGRYDEILRRGHFPSAHRLNLKKGSMWIQDVRTLHRGTPNPSPEPRPELVLCYCRNWWSIAQNVEMPQDSFDRLSAKGQQLLGRCKIVQWD